MIATNLITPNYELLHNKPVSRQMRKCVSMANLPGSFFSLGMLLTMLVNIIVGCKGFARTNPN